MNCQWQALLNILPPYMRKDVDTLGREGLQELRLRIQQKPELVLNYQLLRLDREVSPADIQFTINSATQYSPWTSESIRYGYITANGGHRIGVCGHACYEDGKLKTISSVSSLCIRVARDFHNISGDLYKRRGSVLIIGKPGSGKTTLLRDLIRAVSDLGNDAVTVLDERGELFPVSSGQFSFDRGRRTDVMSGVRKRIGMEMALRTMGPAVIAVDEITNAEDCRALQDISDCGVRLLATAHATDLTELKSRDAYRTILMHGIFRTLVVMRDDKSWYEEVLEPCI